MPEAMIDVTLPACTACKLHNRVFLCLKPTCLQGHGPSWFVFPVPRIIIHEKSSQDKSSVLSFIISAQNVFVDAGAKCSSTILPGIRNYSKVEAIASWREPAWKRGGLSGQVKHHKLAWWPLWHVTKICEERKWIEKFRIGWMLNHHDYHVWKSSVTLEGVLSRYRKTTLQTSLQTTKPPAIYKDTTLRKSAWQSHRTV